MVRTQIQLTESQARALRQRAQERGVSLAEVIRGFVNQGLAAEAPDRAAQYRKAARMVGRWRDRNGARDVAEQHDRYLDGAFR